MNHDKADRKAGHRTRTRNLSRSALMLGSAVAIAGMVAAAPAEAATSSNPCAGMDMGTPAKTPCKPAHGKSQMSGAMKKSPVRASKTGKSAGKTAHPCAAN